MRVAFTNLGCKLNQAELENLARRFAGAGHDVVRSPAEADLHVVNSCTVTHAAARDSRKAVRRGRRHNATLRTVLTGCYVESDPEEIATLAEVDLVVPNLEKERLLERVEDRFPELAATRPTDGDLPYMPLEFGNSRALVKIEDGCDMRCSFCIIPTTRGRQRSRDPMEIVSEARALVDRGFREIVLTGVQISSYRANDSGLYELIALLLAQTTAPRLRLSSIAPWQFDLRLLDLFDSARICRHFHLSLQSGDPRTLRRMRRPYSADEFAALCAAIRKRIPALAITTDVIAGFPGETEAEFEGSLAFVEAMRFARIHAFPYSPRPGTAAAELPDAVSHQVVRRRMNRLLEAARAAERSFARRQLGHTVGVLWENGGDGLWRGTSDNYLRVRARSTKDLARRLVPAELLSTEGGWVDAALCEL